MPNASPKSSRTVGTIMVRVLRAFLLTAAAVFFALHFLHLDADFPNNSPWMDWSKYTDEGWYGDAAIRHYLTGHWYWPGDFNPAVALPVWPVLEWLTFRFTGVSTYAARGLTLVVFGLTLLTFWLLVRRFRTVDAVGNGSSRAPSLAGPLCLAFLCCSPFLYVFERMAILEPLLVLLTALALLAASHLHVPHATRATPGSPRVSWLPSLALAILLPAMVLTKTTGLFLFPAVLYMIWARAGYRIGLFVRLALPPLVGGGVLWSVYFFGLVHPHFLEDYRYLFSANGYNGFGMQPFPAIVLAAISDGLWMGRVLYPAFFVLLALALFWRPRILGNPVLPSLLLWVGGYFLFLGYHSNFQPRYYLVVAVPITAAVALLLDELPRERRAQWLVSMLAAGIAAAILVPDALQQLEFIRHPTYQFRAAAEGIKRIVLAQKDHSHLVLSISGSDLTLMTGLPSIDDDYGTLDLDKRVAQYRPGWYAAWNELDDDKADALSPLYQTVRVAAFPAMDDPDRNLLILYRLDPKSTSGRRHGSGNPKRTPKQLQTKLGQQPTTTQLLH